MVVALKFEVSENWSMTSTEIVDDPDNEDLWQATCGDYILDIGSQAGKFRCRAIRHWRWEEPVDEVTFSSAAKAFGWANNWMERLA